MKRFPFTIGVILGITASLWIVSIAKAECQGIEKPAIWTAPTELKSKSSAVGDVTFSWRNWNNNQNIPVVERINLYKKHTPYDQMITWRTISPTLEGITKEQFNFITEGGEYYASIVMGYEKSCWAIIEPQSMQTPAVKVIPYP